MMLIVLVTPAKTDVLVIGAGVSGLTTGVCLAEAGLSVRLLSDRQLTETTSAAAGASWSPYMLGDDDQRVIGWGERTREVLQALAGDSDHGVSMVLGIDAVRHEEEPPDWVLRLPATAAASRMRCRQASRSGWWYEIPLIDMPRYLAYLERRLRRAGGTIESRHIESLGDVSGSGRVTVNCAGIGARTLVPDDRLGRTRAARRHRPAGTEDRALLPGRRGRGRYGLYPAAS